ncbi:MAG: serine hydrolase [Pseudomonadota bacterium]
MSGPSRRGLLAGGGLALAAVTARAAPRPKGPAAGPGRAAWSAAEPASQGLSSAALRQAADALAVRGERQGLVVVRHGRLAFEAYWRNAWHLDRPDWPNVSFSSGKSWGATMIGRAVTEGRLRTSDLMARYHPAATSGLKPETTIEHVLTMTSGGTLNVKPSSRPPRKLDDPGPPGPAMEYAWQPEGERGSPPGYGRTIAPGSTFYYDGAPADHLADVTAAATGMTSHRYMMEHVVAPLGCEVFRYQPEGVDRAGNIRIGGSILLSCRDMARLGQLYLNRGRWGSAQLVEADYITRALTPSPLNASYGYLWWLNGEGRVASAPRDMAFAAGARGQFCFVLPAHDMVVATMGFGEAQLSAEQAWQALAPILPRV